MDYSDWTTQELSAKLKSGAPVRLCDVRDPDEYAAGHIRGAVLLPLGKLQSYLPEMDRAKEYAIICRSGNRSSQAVLLMRKAGFPRVHNITGGMLAWKGPTV